MDPKTAEALQIIRALVDQVALTGPQRRQVDAAVAHLETKVTPAPAPAAPANDAK